MGRTSILLVSTKLRTEAPGVQDVLHAYAMPGDVFNDLVGPLPLADVHVPPPDLVYIPFTLVYDKSTHRRREWGACRKSST